MSRVGENIKNARVACGMSQKQLGKKLGVAESFIYDVELGRKVLNENLVARISKILNTDINDMTMYEDEKEEKKSYDVSSVSSKDHKKKKEEVNEVWSDALGSVLKDVPVLSYDLKSVLGSKTLPIVSNKIEGHAQDKVFFLQVQDDDMVGSRIAKGDIAFCHVIHEVENNSICLLEMNSERVIRQVKKLDSSKLLLISNSTSVRTETVNIKDIKVIARLDRLEIKL